MTVPPAFPSKGLALIAAAVLTLTACTNASETGSTPRPTGGSSASRVDAATVEKDDSLASQVPRAIKAKGVLTIGSDTTFAPAEFLGGSDNHTPEGYDVDLADAIGAKLGLRVDVESATFASILPALGPKYDLGVSSFFIKPERLKAVNMVSYAVGGSAWAVQKGNPKNFSPDAVCGTSVGVQTGSIQADDVDSLNSQCQAQGRKSINVMELDKQTDITTRLVSGTIDAMVSGSDVVGYAAQQTNGAVEKIGATYGTAPVGIAVAKDDMALAQLVQKTVTDLMADGTYKRILDSWNVSDIAIAKSAVNPAVPS